MWRDAGKRARPPRLKDHFRRCEPFGCVDTGAGTRRRAQNDPVAAATMLDQKLAWHSMN